MSSPRIESYRFGKIVIDGTTFEKDVIIISKRVLPNWRREQGHSLNMNDLREVIAAQSKTLIVGTGTFGRMNIPAETLSALQALGIEVIAAKTEQACQLYNQRKDDGGVAAALHLTC